MQVVGPVLAVVLLSGLLTGAASVPPVTTTQQCFFNVNDGSYGCVSGSRTANTNGQVSPSTLGAAGVTPAATYLLAVLYEDTNMKGASLSIVTSHSDLCVSHYYTDNLPSGWKNRVSSFSMYGTCGIILYDLDNEKGSYSPKLKGNQGFPLEYNDIANSYKITA